MFVSSDNSTEALALSGKANVFPYNYVLQANLLKKEVKRILASPHSLKTGDYIFVAKKDLSEIEYFLIARLQREFRFEIKEVTPHQIMAIKLKKT